MQVDDDVIFAIDIVMDKAEIINLFHGLADCQVDPTHVDVNKTCYVIFDPNLQVYFVTIYIIWIKLIVCQTMEQI